MAETMREFDLAIIGASFAGLVAARRAAEKGLSVAVVEKKTEPGAHVHTTGILVREAAELMAVPDKLVNRVAGIRLYAPSLRFFDLKSEGYYFLATNTPEYLRWLAKQAEDAGAEMFYGETFDGAQRVENGFELSQPNIAARYLLGADGAHSRVVDYFGLGRNKRFLVGLEVEYKGVKGLDGDYLHTFLDSKTAPGYIGWVVPGAGVTQVGLACKRADKPNLAAFTERISSLFDFSEAEITERRSGVIPCGGCVSPASTQGVLLVGDAAGMVSPMTAGGIFTAFDFGAQAADAIADHLKNGAPDPADFLPKTYPTFRFKKTMRRALDLGPPNWFLNLMVGTRPMQALARLVYFHTKGLGSGSAWRDLFRRKNSRGPKASPADQ